MKTVKDSDWGESDTRDISSCSNHTGIPKESVGLDAANTIKKAKRRANISLLLGILSWVLYVTVIPSLVCAIFSWRLGKKSRIDLKTKRAILGVILSGILLLMYILSAILVTIVLLFL